MVSTMTMAILLVDYGGTDEQTSYYRTVENWSGMIFRPYT